MLVAAYLRGVMASPHTGKASSSSSLPLPLPNAPLITVSTSQDNNQATTDKAVEDATTTIDKEQEASSVQLQLNTLQRETWKLVSMPVTVALAKAVKKTTKNVRQRMTQLTQSTHPMDLVTMVVTGYAHSPDTFSDSDVDFIRSLLHSGHQLLPSCCRANHLTPTNLAPSTLSPTTLNIESNSIAMHVADSSGNPAVVESTFPASASNLGNDVVYEAAFTRLLQVNEQT